MNKESQKVMRIQKQKKVFAIKFYGGKCVLCGYDKCMDALEFHHRDKRTKKAKPSYIVRRWAWERVKEELDKCDLLCSNCHKETHSQEFNGVGTRAAENLPLKQGSVGSSPIDTTNFGSCQPTG